MNYPLLILSLCFAAVFCLVWALAGWFPGLCAALGSRLEPGVARRFPQVRPRVLKALQGAGRTAIHRRSSRAGRPAWGSRWRDWWRACSCSWPCCCS